MATQRHLLRGRHYSFDVDVGSAADVARGTRDSDILSSLLEPLLFFTLTYTHSSSTPATMPPVRPDPDYLEDDEEDEEVVKAPLKVRKSKTGPKIEVEVKQELPPATRKSGRIIKKKVDIVKDSSPPTGQDLTSNIESKESNEKKEGLFAGLRCFLIHILSISNNGLSASLELRSYQSCLLLVLVLIFLAPFLLDWTSLQ